MFRTTKSELKGILPMLSASVPKKDSNDIYSFVLFSNSDAGQIEACSTSRSTTAKTVFDGTWEEEFDICLEYKRLANLIPLLSHEDVEITIPSDGWAIIKNGKSKHKLPTRKADLFPIISYSEKARLQVNVHVLYRALKACNIATSKVDKASWKLSCVGLKTDGNVLNLRSCDGTQISRASITLDKEYETIEALIPQEAINFLIKFSNSKTDETIDIVICHNHLVFEKGSDRLILTTVAGVFPEIDKLIRSDLANELTASVQEVNDALKRTSTASSESTNIKVSILGEEINFLTESQRGKALEVVDCVSNVTEKLDFGLNGKQVVDFLSEFKGAVKIGIDDPTKAIHFRPLEETEFTFVYLSMPTV